MLMRKEQTEVTQGNREIHSGVKIPSGVLPSAKQNNDDAAAALALNLLLGDDSEL